MVTLTRSFVMKSFASGEISFQSSSWNVYCTAKHKMSNDDVITIKCVFATYLTGDDLLNERSCLLWRILPRRIAAQQNVHDYAQRPHVHHLSKKK